MADKFFKSLTFFSGDRHFPLPIVTADDAGKVLKVINGDWGVGEFPKKLVKIEVTSFPTTVNYTEGDSLDLTGLVVTATFDNGTTADVTSECTISPSDGTVLETTDTSISIRYTYKGVTRITSQVIVVESAIKIVTWADGTDEEIAAMVEAAYEGKIDLSQYWSVGDTRSITLPSYGTTKLRLLSRGGKTIASGDHAGEECQFVFDFEGVIAKTTYDSTIQSDYLTKYFRGELHSMCNTIYNDIPNVIKNILKPWTCVVAKEQTSWDAYTDTYSEVVYLAAPACKEVGYSNSYVTGENNAVNTLDYYANDTINTTASLKHKADFSGNNVDWWFRTPCNNGTAFMAFANGLIDMRPAYNTFGCSPIGCI